MLERLRFAPFLAQLVVTRRCNLACGYCNEYDKTSEPVPFDVLSERIAQLRRLGTFTLDLTGGEPMLHPRIFELVAHARRQKFLRVMMISNAYLLSEQRVKELNSAGLQSMQISVDGVRTNETTIKVLDVLRSKLEVVARHARFEVVISAVVGSAPTDEVLEVIAFAKTLRFRSRVLLLHDGHGRLQMSPTELEDYHRVMRALGKRGREAHDYRSRLARGEQAPFRCRAGSRYLYVDEHGVVHWCSQAQSQFGVPLEQYDRQELRRQFFTQKECSTFCTVGCARSNSAYDEFRGQPLEGPRRLPVLTTA